MQRLVIVLNKEGDTWVVTSPTLAGLVTEGSTVDEALASAREALAAITESYVQREESIPWEDAAIKPPYKKRVTPISLFRDDVVHIDVDTVHEMIEWGAGDPKRRDVFFNNAKSINPIAVSMLAGWGRGEPGDRVLHLDGLESLDEHTARVLSNWGRGEAGTRGLLLNGVTTIGTSALCYLAEWGFGEVGHRALFLNGVTVFNEFTILALREFQARENCELYCCELEKVRTP